MNLFSFDAVYRQHLTDQLYQLLESCCAAANQIAIHSLRLTEYMRKKYASHRVRIAGKTFYLFPRDAVPHDVYYKVIQPAQKMEKVGG